MVISSKMLTTLIELDKSTALFGKLADPNDANNPLSQVLYGLALRLVFRVFSRASRQALLYI